MEQFVDETLNYVKEMIPADCVAEKTTVLKNNNLILHGIAIKSAGSNTAPTFYLDGYFERKYTSKETAIDIAEHYKKMEQKAPLDFNVEDILDYDKVQEKICYKVIGAEANRQYLESGVPYGEIAGNLAVTYYIALGDDATVAVNNAIMEMWGIDEDELYAVADMNTARLFPPTFESMSETMLHILEQNGQIEGLKYQYGLEEMDNQTFKKFIVDQLDITEMPIYVLRTGESPFGAAAILYDGVLEMVREKIGRDFLLLPSSVHETLIVPYDTELSISDFREIVQEVNATQVEITERLSDSVYFCNGRDIVLLNDNVVPAYEVLGAER